MYWRSIYGTSAAYQIAVLFLAGVGKVAGVQSWAISLAVVLAVIAGCIAIIEKALKDW